MSVETKKSTVKARKAHRCMLCGFEIPAGEEYHYARLGPPDHPDNDHWFSVHAHVDCWEMWIKVGDDFDWIFPFSGQEFLEVVTVAGYAVPCQTCDGTGLIHETEGTPKPKGWSYYKHCREPFPWVECISCDGHGYSERRPVPTAKLKCGGG